MHCPKCGQQQVSEDTRFCSRCGFLLAGVSEVVANGGLLPGSQSTQLRSGPTPRSTGLKQGLFIFLLSFLLVPLAIVISQALQADEFASVIITIILTVGGILRMAYALMFESGEPSGDRHNEADIKAEGSNFFNRQPKPNELPPHQSIPISAYVPAGTGAWRDTNELNEPGSVTDNSTKLLQKEEQL
ncbi:MAG: zinc ribbon domain-containing protein [Saprospiraceae bacterium]|nr:zinc ribbon domain-containing protein [Pyrinomonadaceae bacterium]